MSASDERTLEQRVADLEWLAGVIARQIAEPRNKPTATNEPGTHYRIVRAPNAPEVRSDVARLLDDLGLSDLDFKVM